MSQTLADVFEAVAQKRLVQVDLPGGSNQHELNGKKVFQEFFRTSERVEGSFTWHYFSDDREVATEESTFTWYDSRLRGAERTGRSEWRFYYHDDFLAQARAGDELFLVRTKNQAVHALVFGKGSAWLRSARLLFGVTTATDQIQLIPDTAISKQDLELVRGRIIEELDLEIQIPALGNDQDLVIGRFGEQFPKTLDMAVFAREQVEVNDADPDATLVAWLNREEQLFRALEEVIIGRQIKEGFSTVDEFIRFSLTVQNRRKSRMGHALQNHLAEVFKRRGVRYTAQAKTEGGNKPDFIFPSEAEYHNTSFDAALLIMLAVKSSAKDRWRQILPEAERIKDKHLCTLEPGISENQTSQMAKERVRLVVPSSVHATYSDAQQATLMNLSGFIDFVRSKQT